MFGIGKKKETKELNWKNLNSISQLDEIVKASNEKAVVIFKHSTRCSISSMAMSRLKSNWKADNDFYYLDLISYRDISNAIAHKFGVEHQSPQVIILKNGQTIFEASHSAIDVSSMSSFLD